MPPYNASKHEPIEDVPIEPELTQPRATKRRGKRVRKTPKTDS